MSADWQHVAAICRGQCFFARRPAQKAAQRILRMPLVLPPGRASRCLHECYRRIHFRCAHLSGPPVECGCPGRRLCAPWVIPMYASMAGAENGHAFPCIPRAFPAGNAACAKALVFAMGRAWLSGALHASAYHFRMHRLFSGRNCANTFMAYSCIAMLVFLHATEKIWSKMSVCRAIAVQVLYWKR